MVYWSSWGRGSNWSCSCWPTPQPQPHQIWAMSATYTAACSNARFLTHWVRPGIEPISSGRQCRVLNPLSHSRNSALSVLKAPSHSEFHSKGSSSSLFSFSCRGSPIRPHLGTQMQQNLAIPRNSLSSLLAFRGARLQMATVLSQGKAVGFSDLLWEWSQVSHSHLWYLSLFLWHYILYRAGGSEWWQYFVRGLLGRTVIRMLPVYWRRGPSPRCRSFRSLAKDGGGIF